MTKYELKFFYQKYLEKIKIQKRSRVGSTVLNDAIVKMSNFIQILKGRESPDSTQISRTILTQSVYGFFVLQ